MAVTLKNSDTGKSGRLWHTQQDERKTQGGVRADSIYTFDSDDTILTGLERQETLQLNGIATGNRLSAQSDWPNDPLQALAEWVVHMQSFVNGKQGTGYDLVDDEREERYRGLVTEFAWQKNKGEKYEAKWYLTLKRGEGISVAEDTTPPSVSPQPTATLDGYDLHSLTSWREEKTQRARVYPIALADSGENQAMSKTGAKRRIQINGTVTGESERNTFDTNINSLIGGDETVTYRSAFPGEEVTVMVDQFESTREAGLTRLGEYALELVEGKDLSGQ